MQPVLQYHVQVSVHCDQATRIGGAMVTQVNSNYLGLALELGLAQEKDCCVHRSHGQSYWHAWSESATCQLVQVC